MKIWLALLLILLAISSWQLSFQNMTRVLHPSGRHLVNMHLEVSDIYGNSTGLMYYYVNVYIGEGDNIQKQALIIDTGSGVTCFPCKDYCTHCGKHLNPYFDTSESETLRILDCKKDKCSWADDNKCKFTQAYGEGSSYQGFWVEDSSMKLYSILIFNI